MFSFICCFPESLFWRFLTSSRFNFLPQNRVCSLCFWSFGRLHYRRNLRTNFTSGGVVGANYPKWVVTNFLTVLASNMTISTKQLDLFNLSFKFSFYFRMKQSITCNIWCWDLRSFSFSLIEIVMNVRAQHRQSIDFVYYKGLHFTFSILGF